MTTDLQNQPAEYIAFIGGGNMANAIIGGLLRQGVHADRIDVVEPYAETRSHLESQRGIKAMAQPGTALERADLVVWAVKPQTFLEAALQVRAYTPDALHLSIAAGIRSDSIARWLESERIVRAMPNTPALIGRGMTAAYARPSVNAAERGLIDQVLATMGESLWVEQEEQLDAVTALSGSGPAYVFYFIEAMVQSGVDMGLPREQAHKLAVATFGGASELARRSDEPPELLRQRVTSKGGTTYAAIRSMEQDGVNLAFMRAMHAARHRARELGEEFGDKS